jgi:hypothetical protein
MKKLIPVLLTAVILLMAGCAPVVLPTPSTPPPPSPSPSASASASLPPSPSPSPSPSAPLPPSPSPSALTVADYFPFTPNVHMSYLGAGNEYAGFDSWVDYVNNGAIQLRTYNGGTESVNVYLINSGALEKVFMQAETYYVYDYTAQNTMSDVLIMEPIAVGTTWTLTGGEQRAITSTNAAVTVPYGTFTALEVTTTYADSVIKEYYVQALGLVKRDYTSNDDPSYHITSELQAVTTEAYARTIRFYYPDFDNDRLAYVDKSVQFKTNDTLESKFEDGFKNIPAGSGLSHVMTKGAVLNSVTYDIAGGVVTADLSKAFITEMNAGTSLEGMLLESIADTLGGYFQTDKVSITIDGGPYESGHFLFNAGDYLPYRPDEASPAA